MTTLDPLDEFAGVPETLPARWSIGADARNGGEQLQLVAEYRVVLQLVNQCLPPFDQLRIGSRA